MSYTPTLIGHWPLNETWAGPRYDISGFNHHLSQRSDMPSGDFVDAIDVAANFGPGYWAAKFSGSNWLDNHNPRGDVAKAPYALNVHGDPWSVEALVCIDPASEAKSRAIAGLWDATNNDRSWLLYVDATRRPRLLCSYDGGANDVDVKAAAIMPGKWYHVTAGLDRFAGEAWIAVDHGPPVRVASGQSNYLHPASCDFMIGNRADVNPDPNVGQSTAWRWRGMLRGVKVFRGLQA